MAIDKVDRVVLSSAILSELDAKATKTELQTAVTNLQNDISAVVTNMDWKESVATFNDLSITYPNAVDGWTANTKDTDITYRYSGTLWIPISANSIPMASDTVDGKLSKEDYTKISTVQANAQPNLTASEMLTAIKTVDGVSSGLDADTFQEHLPSYFSVSTHDHDGRYYTETEMNVLLGGKSDTTHIHGDIASDGKVGVIGNLVLTTGTDGKITAKTAGTTAQYLCGDGSWATPPDTIYTLPTASDTLGGVKSGTGITVDATGNVSVNNDSHNHVLSNITNYGNIVLKDGSIAMDDITIGTRSGTVGTNSFAQGLNCEASGSYSHTEGSNTTANASQAHAEGDHTTASGLCAHAEGLYTIASGAYSHTEGRSTNALTLYAHTEGRYTLACNGTSYNITAFNDTLKTITLDNITGLVVNDLLQIHVSGGTAVIDQKITAINDLVVTLDGTPTITASWKYAIEKTGTPNPTHAEGYNTLASGEYAHAEGNSTTVSGNYAHAEGGFTTASGSGSHAEGGFTTASGNFSHSQNMYTIAQGYGQTAIGRFNVAQGTAGSVVATDDALIIGNGTTNALRSNAFKVSFDGKAWAQEGFYVGANNNKVITQVSPPASATATGIAGQVAYDADYFYTCVATNTWCRYAKSAW